MLRLARLQRILAKYEDLDWVQSYAGVAALLFVIVFAAHILACLWCVPIYFESVIFVVLYTRRTRVMKMVLSPSSRYAIGVSDSHYLLGRPEPGWVLLELCHVQCRMDLWDEFPTPKTCDTYRDALTCRETERCDFGMSEDFGFVDADGCFPRKLCQVGCEVSADVSLAWRYTTSMWYVFGSLDPKYRTLPERTFAIFAYFVMVIIDGAVAGVLASVMIRMGGKDQEVNDKLNSAKLWMREHRIPKDDASKGAHLIVCGPWSSARANPQCLLSLCGKLWSTSALYTRVV